MPANLWPTNIEWGLRGIQDVLNIHPLFVPFPIALLLSSFGFYVLGSVFRNEDLLAAGKWSLYFGTLAAAVTVWAGLEAEKTVPHGEDVHNLMIIHKYFGFAVLALSSLLSGWVYLSKSHIPSKMRLPFLSVHLLLSLLLIQGADFGGRMVFFHGVGLGRKVEGQAPFKTGSPFFRGPDTRHPHEHEGHAHPHDHSMEESSHEHGAHHHGEHTH